MQLCQFPIHPGDVGTKVQFLQGYGGTFGREVSMTYARKTFRDVWDLIVKCHEINLYLDEETGIYYVLDGQHRIEYAATVLKETVTFNAIIRTKEDMAGLSLAQWILDRHSGRRFSMAHILQTLKGKSIWPRVFAEEGVKPAYRSKGSKLTWPAIMRAISMIMEVHRRHRVHGVVPRPSVSRIDMIDLWLSPDEEMIRGYAEVIQWWNDKVAEPAYQLHDGLRTLRSYSGLATGILIYMENEGSEAKALQEAPSRLLAWRGLPAIRGLSVVHFDTILIKCLYAINRRRSVHRLTVLGIDGSEPTSM